MRSIFKDMCKEPKANFPFQLTVSFLDFNCVKQKLKNPNPKFKLFNKAQKLSLMYKNLLFLIVISYFGHTNWNTKVYGRFSFILIPLVISDLLHIILGDEYLYYKDALELCQLESLENMRVELCYKYANKAVKSDKFKK